MNVVQTLGVAATFTINNPGSPSPLKRLPIVKPSHFLESHHPMAASKPYCIFYKDGRLTRVEGSIREVDTLALLPQRSGDFPLASISLVPYCQIRERGFEARSGGEKIRTLVVERVEDLSVESFLASSEVPISIPDDLTFNLSDEQFTTAVRTVIDDEIKRGEGSNFLISRKCAGQIAAFEPGMVNTILKRLIQNETGAYCTFCFHDGERYHVGASPERHLSYFGKTVMMNPICGTLSKTDLKTRADLIEFLLDPKEIHELFQVVDEELKMMAKICRFGGYVEGPYIKEMRTLLHTEYLLRGESDLAPLGALELSMFAPTMIGSPLENAARVICKYENEPRRYYSGVLVFLGQDEHGRDFLDSSITIRTMEIDGQGRFVIQSGASIVRDSVPEKECAEVKAKARGLLVAMSQTKSTAPVMPGLMDHTVERALNDRNQNLSRFWKDKQSLPPASARLEGTKVVIVDNEDEFTYMLQHMLEHLGLATSVVQGMDAGVEIDRDVLVIVGPGPGDPNNLADVRIRNVHRLTQQLLAEKRKFLAVCLGHQVLSAVLGFKVVAVDPPLQGVQERIDLFGKSEIVGFYNTFFALQDHDREPAGLNVCANPEGRIYALKSPNFVSFQFHLESILTQNGTEILQDALWGLLR
jgi:phenazine biosynthesis protein phzE